MKLDKVKTALTTAVLLAPAVAFAEGTSNSGTTISPSISMSLDTANLIGAVVGIGGAIVGVSAVIYGIRKIKSLIAG